MVRDSKRIGLSPTFRDIPSAQIWTAQPTAARRETCGTERLRPSPRFSSDSSKLAILLSKAARSRPAPTDDPLAGVSIRISSSVSRPSIEHRPFHASHAATFCYSTIGRPTANRPHRGSRHGDAMVDRSALSDQRRHGEMREIYKPKLQLADPRVSPTARTSHSLRTHERRGFHAAIFTWSPSAGAQPQPTPRLSVPVCPRRAARSLTFREM